MKRISPKLMGKKKKSLTEIKLPSILSENFAQNKEKTMKIQKNRTMFYKLYDNANERNSESL